MFSDSRDRYGSVSRILHWLMGFLILWQLMKFFDRIADGEHWVGQTLVPWHVSIGTLLLLLVLIRVIWAFTQRRQRPVQDPATAALVKAGHGLLYALMLIMPLTGILKMVGGGYGLSAFGIQLIGKGPEVAWAATLGELHSPLSWALLVLILGHIAIALFHQFVKKDGTLRRMV